MDKYINADKMLKDTLAMKEIADAVSINGLINYIKKYSIEVVQPVRHAHWQKLGYTYFCSGKDGCGFSVSGNLWLDIGYYCPRCGAKMDEREEEQ